MQVCVRACVYVCVRVLGQVVPDIVGLVGLIPPRDKLGPYSNAAIVVVRITSSVATSCTYVTLASISQAYVLFILTLLAPGGFFGRETT